MKVSQKLGLKLPYDLWFGFIITGCECEGIEVSTPQRIGTPLFIMVPFIVIKWWDQLRYQLIDKWTRKISYTQYLHNEVLLSHKKEWNYVIFRKKIKRASYHQVNWNQLDSERHTIHSSSPIWNPEFKKDVMGTTWKEEGGQRWRKDKKRQWKIKL